MNLEQKISHLPSSSKNKTEPVHIKVQNVNAKIQKKNEITYMLVDWDCVSWLIQDEIDHHQGI